MIFLLLNLAFAKGCPALYKYNEEFKVCVDEYSSYSGLGKPWIVKGEDLTDKFEKAGLPVFAHGCYIGDNETPYITTIYDVNHYKKIIGTIFSLRTKGLKITKIVRADESYTSWQAMNPDTFRYHGLAEYNNFTVYKDIDLKYPAEWMQYCNESIKETIEKWKQSDYYKKYNY